MKINICMIGYTNYLMDTRVRREAETLAELPEYTVRVLTLKDAKLSPKTYNHDGIYVQVKCLAEGILGEEGVKDSRVQGFK